MSDEFALKMVRIEVEAYHYANAIYALEKCAEECVIPEVRADMKKASKALQGAARLIGEIE